jgi:toxin ParE1/3/4
MDEQTEYLARSGGAALAERFVDAVEQTAADLAGMPGMGSPCEFTDPRLAGLRRWPVKGFRNHLIFYRPTPDGIEILHVLHGATDFEALFGDSGG